MQAHTTSEQQETITTPITKAAECQKATTTTRTLPGPGPGPASGKLDHTDIQSVQRFSNKQRAHLLKAGFTTTTEILYTPLSSLSSKLKLSQSEAREIISCIVNQRLSASASNKAGGIFSSASVADRLTAVQDEDRSVLSTGQKALDDLLGGGIRTGTLTEIAGEAASGKTAFALQLSLQVQLPISQGGLSGSCAYLSSEGNFPSQRLLDIASTYSCWNGDGTEDVQRAMDNVHLLHCSEVEPLLHAVRYTLPALVELQLNRQTDEEGNTEMLGTQMVPSSNQADYRDVDFLLPTQLPPHIPVHQQSSKQAKKPVKLIIVDSIAAPFRGAETSSSNHFSDRTKDLAEAASLLYRLAQRYGIAVVLINQVSDVMSSSDSKSANNAAVDNKQKAASRYEQHNLNDGFPLDYRQYAHASRFFSGESAGTGGKMAVFGLAWANLINARVMLTRTGKRRRISDGREVEYVQAEMDADGGEINNLNTDSEEVRRMDIVFSPFAELGFTEYVLRQEGLVGVGTVYRTPRGVKESALNNDREEGEDTLRASQIPSVDSQADEEDEEAALWKGLSSDPAFEDE